MQGLNRWHWVIISLTLLFSVAALYYPVRYYSELPPQIPTHFSLTGEPDSWSEKNLGELLLAPLLVLPGAVLLLPLVWWMSTVKDPRQILSLPGKKATEIPLKIAEQIRGLTITHILIIQMLVSLLVFLIVIGQIMVALGIRTSLGYGSLLVTMILLGDSIILIWRLFCLTYRS